MQGMYSQMMPGMMSSTGHAIVATQGPPPPMQAFPGAGQPAHMAAHLARGPALGAAGMGRDQQAHQELVERIKAGQRTSDHWKQLWWSWCDTQGRGKRDPAKHSVMTLLQAFQHIGHPPTVDPAAVGPRMMVGPRQGQPPVSWGAVAYRGGGGGGGGGRKGRGGRGRPAAPSPEPVDSQHRELIRRIKGGQRGSEDWKRQWWQWCEQKGGTRDPAKHPPQALMEAIAQIGDPPAGPPPLPPAPEPTGEALLVCQRIKACQKANPAFKAAWGSFCDEHGESKRDPARHNLEFLRAAIQQCDPTGSVYQAVQQQNQQVLQQQQQQQQAVHVLPQAQMAFQPPAA